MSVIRKLARKGLRAHQLQLYDHTDRGVGGRQYGSSEDIEALQGKSNDSASRFQQSKNAVLHSLGAASSQESYGHAIDEFIGWYCSEPRLAFNRPVVLRYRFFLEQKNLVPPTINMRLAAVRRLAYEASDTGLLSPDLAGRNPPRQRRKASGRKDRQLVDR
jgi:hypothetical protein